MDNKFWKLALAIFYMLFGGITLAFNQNGLKAIIITCGVSLVILGVYIFFFADKNSYTVSMSICIMVFGASISLFCRFFIDIALFLCSIAICSWAIIRYTNKKSICAFCDCIVGGLLLISVFFIRKFLLLVVATVMIFDAITYFLALMGFIED